MRLVSPENEIPGIRIFNKAQLAEAFGVTLPTIEAWVRKACPVRQRGGRGISWEFDIFDVYSWRYDVGVNDGDADPEQMTPRERLDYYKGCRERDAHRKDSGELIHVSDVTAAWSKIVGVTKGRLMGLPMRVAPALVAATDLRAVEDAIREGIVSALEDLADAEIE